jgi:hypothetical protein
VHILKELAIFPNSHTKFDQGAIAAQFFHLGRCPKIWLLGTSVKVYHLDFQPKKWVMCWISSKRWVPQGGDAQNNWTSAFNPSRVSPCLMVLGTLNLEDFKVPYLTTSIV